MNAVDKKNEDRLIDEAELLDEEVVLLNPQETDDDHEFLNRAGTYDWEVTTPDDEDKYAAFDSFDPEDFLDDDEQFQFINHRRRRPKKRNKTKQKNRQRSPYDWDEDEDLANLMSQLPTRRA